MPQQGLRAEQKQHGKRAAQKRCTEIELKRGHGRFPSLLRLLFILCGRLFIEQPPQLLKFAGAE